MSDSVQELVAELRAAGVAFGDRHPALEPLAAKLRALLEAFGAREGVPPGDLDDLVQRVLIGVMPHLLAGDVDPGCEIGYAKQAFRFARRGQKRGAAARTDLATTTDEGSPLLTQADPTVDVQQQLEGRELAQWLLNQLQDPSIPQAHRDVVRRHCVEGVPLPQLVEDELAKLPKSTSVEESKLAQTRARNRVYQNLKRGRETIAERLARYERGQR